MRSSTPNFSLSSVTCKAIGRVWARNLSHLSLETPKTQTGLMYVCLGVVYVILFCFCLLIGIEVTCDIFVWPQCPRRWSRLWDCVYVCVYVSRHRENLRQRDRLVRPVYVCVFKCDGYKNLKLQIDNYFPHLFGQGSKRNFSVYDWSKSKRRMLRSWVRSCLLLGSSAHRYEILYHKVIYSCFHISIQKCVC